LSRTIFEIVDINDMSPTDTSAFPVWYIGSIESNRPAMSAVSEEHAFYIIGRVQVRRFGNFSIGRVWYRRREIF